MDSIVLSTAIVDMISTLGTINLMTIWHGHSEIVLLSVHHLQEHSKDKLSRVIDVATHLSLLAGSVPENL